GRAVVDDGDLRRCRKRAHGGRSGGRAHDGAQGPAPAQRVEERPAEMAVGAGDDDETGGGVGQVAGSSRASGEHSRRRGPGSTRSIRAPAVGSSSSGTVRAAKRASGASRPGGSGGPRRSGSASSTASPASAAPSRSARAS